MMENEKRFPIYLTKKELQEIFGCLHSDFVEYGNYDNCKLMESIDIILDGLNEFDNQKQLSDDDYKMISEKNGVNEFVYRPENSGPCIAQDAKVAKMYEDKSLPGFVHIVCPKCSSTSTMKRIEASEWKCPNCMPKDMRNT